MRIAGVLIACGLAAYSASASAAAPPNLVGTWVPTPDSVAASLGKAPASWPEAPTPNLRFGSRPVIVIEKQDGRALSGYAIAPDNSHLPFVALIRRSGRSLIGSMSTGIINADIGRNDIEWCWTDKILNSAIAACDVLKKQAGK